MAHRDETGWKLEAQLRWLWAVVTEQVTFCEILPGRGFAAAGAILGAEYAGWLIHNGWAVYYKFLKQLLEQGLGLRDRYRSQEISLHGLWTATGRQDGI